MTRFALIPAAAATALLAALSGTPAQAQAQAPALRSDIVEAITMLPIPDFKAIAADLYQEARKEASRAPWHSARKGNFQLHFYSQGEVQMAFVVYEGTITLSKLPMLQGDVWRRLGDAEFNTPIFSLSIARSQSVPAEGTTPAMLSQALKGAYPGMSSFSVEPGVQVFTRAGIKGVVGSAIQLLGAPASHFWLRAGMTGDPPTGGAASQAKVRESALMRNGNMVKNLNSFMSARDRVASADNIETNLFIEIQTPPGVRWTAPLGMQDVAISDAIIFVDNSPKIGFLANATFSQVPRKVFPMHFEVPIEGGGPNWAKSQMALSTPHSITLAEFAMIGMALNTAAAGAAGKVLGEKALTQKSIDGIKVMLRPLSVFAVRNPDTGVRFAAGGDYPDLSKFNIVLIGKSAKSPTGQEGPFIAISGEAVVLGQTMARTRTTITDSSLATDTTGKFSLDLGKAKLGSYGFNSRAVVKISETDQVVRVDGSLDTPVVARRMAFGFSPDAIYLSSPANCVVPLELSGRLGLSGTPSFSDVLGAMRSVNIDPSQLVGCTAEQLKALGEATAKVAKEAAEATAQATVAAAKATEEAAKRAAEESARAAQAAANAVAGAATHIANAAWNEGYDGAKQVVNTVGKWVGLNDPQSSTCNRRIEGIRRNGIYPDVNRSQQIIDIYQNGWAAYDQVKRVYAHLGVVDGNRKKAQGKLTGAVNAWNNFATSAKLPAAKSSLPALPVVSLSAVTATAYTMQQGFTQITMAKVAQWRNDHAPHDANTAWKRCTSAWIAAQPLETAEGLGLIPKNGGDPGDVAAGTSQAAYNNVLASLNQKYGSIRNSTTQVVTDYYAKNAPWTSGAMTLTRDVHARMLEAARPVQVATMIPDQAQSVGALVARAGSAVGAAKPLLAQAPGSPQGDALKRVSGSVEAMAGRMKTGGNRSAYLAKVLPAWRDYEAKMNAYREVSDRVAVLDPASFDQLEPAVNAAIASYRALMAQHEGALKELKLPNAEGLRGIAPAEVEGFKGAVEALEEMNASFRPARAA